jgi:hypothetical protein
MHHADPLSSVQEAGKDSTAGAETNGILTHEMRDNPFASLMRKLDRLLDLDPAGAFQLARVALAERIFDGKMEEKLRLRMVEIVDTLHKNGTSLEEALIRKTPLALPVPSIPAFAPAPFGMR